MNTAFVTKIFLLLIFCSGNVFSSGHHADKVFINGSIHTFNQELTVVTAIAIDDGLITLVGTNEEINRSIGEMTEVIDLKGKMMMPSFHDAHSHPVWSGVDQLKCVVSESYDIDIMQAQLKECLSSELTKETGWIVGTQLNIGVFPSGNVDKSFLDKISKDIPIYVDACLLYTSDAADDTLV